MHNWAKEFTNPEPPDSFYFFIIKLLLKQPQRGSNMKWCTSRLVLGFLVGVVCLKRELQNVQMKPTNYLKFSLTVFFFVILTNKFIYSENQIYFRVKWKYLGKGQLQSKEDVLFVN